MKPSDFPSLFSQTYQQARERFLETAQRSKALTSELLHFAPGANGEQLAIDVALLGSNQPSRTVILSSGLHGVEGFFGSAVQLAVLEKLSSMQLPEGVRLVVLHALNPWGFSYLRRTDHENIDCNRNFLLPGESYQGCHELYPQINEFLNPARPPRGIDGFYLQAARLVRKHGFREVQQAISAGQYDFPAGLFYGGHTPSWSMQQFQTHWDEWTGQAAQVQHFDLHTGLGRRGIGKCLLDLQPTPSEQLWLEKIFGPEGVEINLPSSGNDQPREKHNRAIHYQARGTIGVWSRQQYPAGDYLYGCLEFGTFRPLRILKKLRLENQAHFHLPLDSRRHSRFKRKLHRMFCPLSPRWKHHTTEQALQWTMSALFNAPPTSQS